MLIQLSRRKKIAGYVHWNKLPGPIKGTYEQMIGDLPQDKMKDLLTSNYRMEYFADAKCFVYNIETGQVEYKENYDHVPRERLEPANLNTVDGNLLSQTLNWRPGLVEQTPKHTGSDFEDAPDRIDYIISTMHWKEVSEQVMLGVHMADPRDGPVDFTVKV